MKTPDENKCGMECIRTNADRICVKPEKGQCPRCEQLVDEVLAHINLLESTYRQVSKALCGKENATLDELLQAADQLKSRTHQLEHALLLMISQYCGDNEGGVTHLWMEAGETAFALLGLENYDPVEKVERMIERLEAAQKKTD